jgi:PEGA domain
MLVGGSSVFVFSDTQKARRAPAQGETPKRGQATPPAAGRHPTEPKAPTVGRAAPRTTPPPHEGRGEVPGPSVYQYPGIDLRFWYGYPYWYPGRYPRPFPGYFPAEGVTGTVRLDVSETDASVYTDGYYSGIVDDFNDVFHHLTLAVGPHVIEISKPGFKTVSVRVYVQPYHTVTYRETMRPADAEEPALGEENDESAIPSDEASAPPANLLPRPLTAPPGDVCLEATPKDAQVYIDGYYVGIVDDFGGGSERLTLTSGPHHLQLRAEGYETFDRDMSVLPRQVVTYQARMKRLGP